MPKQYLQLDDVRVYYDAKSKSTRIISKDKRLKGSSFQLNLSRDTPASESLHRLLKAEGLVDSDSTNELPLSAVLPRRLPRADRLLNEMDGPPSLSGPADPRTVFLIGETFAGKHLKIDLLQAPMTLTVAESSQDAFRFDSSIREQILDRSGALYHFVSPNFQALKSPGSFQATRDQDRSALTRFEAFGAIAELQNVLVERFTAMDAEGISHWRSIKEMEPVFVLVSEIEEIFGGGNSDDRAAMGFFEHLMRVGRAAGVYGFVSTSVADFDLFPNGMRANMGRRIALGCLDGTAELATLGQSSGYSEKIRSEPGRGVIRTYASKVKAFQAFEPAL